MHNIVDLEGKRILLVGAESDIGRETALLCSRAGAQMILAGASENFGAKDMSRLRGGKHVAYVIDHLDNERIAPWCKHLMAEQSPLDGFVFSAASPELRAFEDITPDALDDTMNLYLFSFVELCRNLAKKGGFHEEGSIVAVSSMWAQQGRAGGVAQSAATAAMNGAIQCMAKELAGKSIRVNAVMPADVSLSPHVLIRGGAPEQRPAGLHACSGTPLDVANLIAYLLSPAARFITGSSIAVDGGRLSS